ncbi:hypothetical protein [Dryocola sp. BD613]|uniref:hypothetical protein n=1 Tax=Dryocola sp. BD613 TaxID=3133272 RepID=UPI003F4FA143
MYDFDMIVVILFLVTYLPIFWFLGMGIASGQLVRLSGLGVLHARAFVPKWAQLCTKISFIIHYCVFLILLAMIDWVHGLAAFGAGILLYGFSPLLDEVYLGVFKRRALRIYKKDPAAGKFLIRILQSIKREHTTEQGKTEVVE